MVPRIAALAVAAACVACSAPQSTTTIQQPSRDEIRPTATNSRSTTESSCDTGSGGMSIEGQLGSISQAELTRVLRPATDQFAACYNDRLAERSYLSGRIELKIRIGTDGAPRWVIPLHSTIGDRPTEQCMIERAMALRFPRPCGGETETVYPLEFEGGDDSRPATPWDSERIRPAIEQHRSALQRCTAGARGPFEVTLYAGPRGVVGSVGVAVPNETAAAAVDCIVREVSSWRLPDPGSWYAKASFRLE